ncbi:hypothetical protein F5Y00DRAFT_171379 [Daldinia vernicosa]|uniref:uncharacterized protein n=1 Tax=Daldinia vernicosa TaxID=114800 RepID=UPI002007E5CC|nr:uncharacterized protein F5Y00DRAFT_171379 [Daldinia vernicosa]KAI0845311.1 hypothetical protein F5Y00DRAFT_171379 [Daldinia vernicosa]
MEAYGNSSLIKGAPGEESPFSTGFQALLSDATRTTSPTSTSYGGPDPSFASAGFIIDLGGSGPRGRPAIGSASEDDCKVKQEGPGPSSDSATVMGGTSQNDTSIPLANTAPGDSAMSSLGLPARPIDAGNIATPETVLKRPILSRPIFGIGRDAPVPQGPPNFAHNQSGSRGSVGPEHAGNFPAVDGKYVTPAMLLSQECQKRRFNPQFTEWHDRNGRCKCSVSLKGLIVSEMRAYNTASEAKAAISKKALIEVRKLPCEDPADKPAAILTEVVKQGIYKEVPDFFGFGSAQTENKPNPQQHRNHQHNQVAPFMQEHRVSRYQPPGNFPNDRHDNYDLHDQQNLLMSQVQYLFGHINGPSNRIAEDPLASRAFLEGIALGSRLGQSTIRHPDTYTYAPPPAPQRLNARPHGDGGRRRERSPVIGPRSHHNRVRSPLRRRNH